MSTLMEHAKRNPEFFKDLLSLSADGLVERYRNDHAFIDTVLTLAAGKAPRLLGSIEQQAGEMGHRDASLEGRPPPLPGRERALEASFFRIVFLSKARCISAHLMLPCRELGLLTYCPRSEALGPKKIMVLAYCLRGERNNHGHLPCLCQLHVKRIYY